MTIILIGYRCTGKTSVGRRIAERLGMPFCDTDDLIRGEAGKSIKEIVAEGGWEAFRARERAAIATLPSMPEAIIGVGGGAVMDAENRTVLKHTGSCVWLTADVRTILARMQADPANEAQRPPLSGAGLELETAAILKERSPIYKALADFSVDTTGKDIDTVAVEVCAILACRHFVGAYRNRMAREPF
jgi:shikimate kinase